MDGRIETAFALARTQHIPQADAVRQEAWQALVGGQAGQVFARQVRQDRPQQISGLKVILILKP